MTLHENILESYKNYHLLFPGEKEQHEIFDRQIVRGDDLITRKNMTGHVTTSGLVFSPNGEILLVYHMSRDRFQQPGGHLELSDETLVEAAAREIREETGISEVAPIEWHAQAGAPISITTQEICVRPEKGEGAHLHHDFMYVFQTQRREVILQEEEVSDSAWVNPHTHEIKDTMTVGKTLKHLRKIGMFDEENER